MLTFVEFIAHLAPEITLDKDVLKVKNINKINIRIISNCLKHTFNYLFSKIS